MFFFSTFICYSFLCCGLFLPPAQVTADRNKTAVRGKKASLSCSYGLPEKVEQVIWRHIPQQGDSTEVASFAKQSDPMIEPPYQGRVWLSASLSDSQLTIQPVAIQDEGCYTCVYSTYADGPKSSTVCLSTYGNHQFSLACLIISLGQTTNSQIPLLIITHKWCCKKHFLNVSRKSWTILKILFKILLFSTGHQYFYYILLWPTQKRQSTLINNEQE